MSQQAGPGNSPESSGLGSLGDVQLLAAMLRSNREDVASYARLLTGALGDALPAGVVEVHYQRSLSDRLAGRPGTATRLIVRAGQQELELGQGAHDVVQAQFRTVVGGVVISRKQVGIDEWVAEFAQVLAALGSQNAAAKAALAALLGI